MIRILVFTAVFSISIPFVLCEASSNLPPCDEDQLMVYLAEIQAINPESVINLSTFEDLDLLCEHVQASLDKMDEYLKTCKVPDQRDLYIQLIKGVDKLHDMICTNTSTLKQKFEHHFACLHDLHQDFEDCYGTPDWAEEENIERVCISYKEVVDCYFVKAAKVCGLHAANVMRELIKYIVDSIVEVKCKLDPAPLVQDAMPDNGNTIISKFGLIVTGFPLLLLRAIS